MTSDGAFGPKPIVIVTRTRAADGAAALFLALFMALFPALLVGRLAFTALGCALRVALAFGFAPGLFLFFAMSPPPERS
jgi:hypothetical protein